jgi:hypothetical protein
VTEEGLAPGTALQPASDVYPLKARASIDILPIVLIIVILRTAVSKFATRNTRVSAFAPSRDGPIARTTSDVRPGREFAWFHAATALAPRGGARAALRFPEAVFDFRTARQASVIVFAASTPLGR